MAYAHTWRLMFHLGAVTRGVDISADRAIPDDQFMKFYKTEEDGYNDTLLAAIPMSMVASIMLWDDEESPFLPID